MTEDFRQYVVESPTRIKLGPDAKFWAEQHGMTLEQMARHLLDQNAAQQPEQAASFTMGGTAVPGTADYNPMANFDLYKFSKGFG
jgi:hypothetical protein